MLICHFLLLECWPTGKQWREGSCSSNQFLPRWASLPYFPITIDHPASWMAITLIVYSNERPVLLKKLFLCSLLVVTVDSDGGYSMGLGLGTVSPRDEATVPGFSHSQQGNAHHYNQQRPSSGRHMDMMNQAGFYGLNADTNMCKPDKAFTWCLPPDYNQEKHPFTCKNPPPPSLASHICINPLISVFHLSNKSLPWDYNFRFVIEEISNINDKAQVREWPLKK